MITNSLKIFALLLAYLPIQTLSVAQDNLPGTPRTTIIKVPDSLSNFKALLQSNELKYLHRMNPQYDNQLPGFWKKLDTTKINVRKTRVFRAGNCKDTLQTGINYENCTHHEYLTVNVFKKKVLQYSLDSKALSAIIEFTYNKTGKLVRYTENGNLSRLEYDENKVLNKVSCYQLKDGKQQLNHTILFKRSRKESSIKKG